MLGCEIDTVTREIKIFLLLLNVVVYVGIGPARPALHPHALVGGINPALAVKAVDKSAKLLVPAVFEPEGHAGI